MKSLIVILLVITPGVWSGDWRVTFKENQCALKGASVVIECEYNYPLGHTVTAVSWSKLLPGSKWLTPLSRLPSPPEHFQYVGNHWSNCNLRVNDAQYIDEGKYYFSFATTFNRWTSGTSTHLSVRELTAMVQPSTVTEGGQVTLTCGSGCPGSGPTVWFREGRPVTSLVFEASREDAGSYHCAVLGQEMVRSVPVVLNVQYAPKRVNLSISPFGDIMRGSKVTLTCSSDANPPVASSGYSIYKDGEFIGSGQTHTLSDLQPQHTGWYHCQAWNNISWRGVIFINSTQAHLDVQYLPINISVSVDSHPVIEGSDVNLTCSGAANPPADNYNWYKKTASLGSSSVIWVGSGQVLSLPSMEASHGGLYFCQVRNYWGENNSTEVMLEARGKLPSGLSLPVIAGIGISLFVTLLIGLLLLRKKQRDSANKKLSEREPVSSSSKDPSDTVYENINIAAFFDPEALAAFEDEVTYSTVTITPRNATHHPNKSRAPQGSWSKLGENADSVIYATVVKSSDIDKEI
ncbi:B-cell receptor CD22-like [Pholidichthys leucotaenia]